MHRSDLTVHHTRAYSIAFYRPFDLDCFSGVQASASSSPGSS